jgi:DNA-directed RNA polymerase specialized sigma24 family protein
MNTPELIEGCLHNDVTTQKYFYTNYSPRVMGICMRYASGAKDTEIMAQYVFKKLFEELVKCPKDTEMNQWVDERAIWNAIAYLHQDKQRYFIAKTTRYMENKNNTGEAIDEATLNTEDSRKIYLAALHALTPSYRILYNLTYVDEVIPEKIIQNLEIARETYKAELEQARFQFKQYLNTYLHENGLRKQ